MIFGEVGLMQEKTGFWQGFDASMPFDFSASIALGPCKTGRFEFQNRRVIAEEGPSEA